MINKTLKNFILQERYFSKSIERSIIKFLDCKDSYVKGGLAEDIIITLVRKSPKNRVGGYEFVSELYRVEKHTVALTGKRDHITAQAEVRWNFYKRWTALAFGGGRIADVVSEIGSANNNFAGGAGFRFMLAEKQKLSIGIDVAYAEDAKVSVYFQIGDWLAN